MTYFAGDRITKTGFGEVSIAENQPFIQGTAVYNFIPSNFRTFTSGSGTAGAEDQMFKVSTGTSQFGYGAIQSFRAINYKPGQSGMARYTALFESSAANSWQGVGLVNLGDELSFGYNGTDFGIWHRYKGKAEVRTITVSGAAGGAENLTLTLNGIAYTVPLTAGTTAHNAYEIANWLNANQSVWGADQLNSTVIVSALSDGAKSGSYSFSSGTATGSIAQNTAGATKTSDFIKQANWNVNTASWLDPSKGNVYQIKYQYLGFGNIKFFIEDPTRGEFVLVHNIEFPNANTTPNLGNPSMRCGMYCVSLGSTTDLVVKSGSMSAFLQSKPVNTRNPRAEKNTQSVSSTFTNVLTIRNRRTYNSLINQVEIEPSFLSLASESSKNTVFELRTTTDTNVEQNFTNVGNNLVADVDKTSVAITAGSLLTSFTLSPGGTKDVNLTDLRIRIPPTLHLCILARVTGGASAAVTAALTWYEDV